MFYSENKRVFNLVGTQKRACKTIPLNTKINKINKKD